MAMVSISVGVDEGLQMIYMRNVKLMQKEILSCPMESQIQMMSPAQVII